MFTSMLLLLLFLLHFRFDVSPDNVASLCEGSLRDGWQQFLQSSFHLLWDLISFKLRTEKENGKNTRNCNKKFICYFPILLVLVVAAGCYRQRECEKLTESRPAIPHWVVVEVKLPFADDETERRVEKENSIFSTFLAFISSLFS